MRHRPSLRRFRILSGRGQRRLVFIAGGLAVGGAATAFAFLADRMQMMFADILSLSRYLSLVVTPAGFALSAFLTARYFPTAGGSGIPQAIAARALSDEVARHRLVSLRTAAGKVVLTALGLLCGASIGREGPTVQIGASLMYAAGHISPRRQRGLILAGAAAGVAAAFNTPLAGIVFAIEEMGRAFEAATSGLVIATVIAAGPVSLAINGDYTYFGAMPLALHGPAGWAAVPLCGAVGGLAGGVFSRIVIAGAELRLGTPWRRLKARPILLATLCGLGVTACGIASQDSIYGTGYPQVIALLHGDTVAHFGPLKFAATLLSALSGIPGGIFSPSLAIGAGIGQDLAQLLPAVPMPVMAVLAMVAYFAGVVQAPITAFVIVVEMTNDHAMMVPLMLAALIGAATSRLICHEGIYHALSHRFLPGRDPR